MAVGVAEPSAVDGAGAPEAGAAEDPDAALEPLAALEPRPGVSQEKAGSSESREVSRRGSGCGSGLLARAGVSSFTAGHFRRMSAPGRGQQARFIC